MPDIILKTDKEYKEIKNKRLNNFSQLQQFDILNHNGNYLFNLFQGYEIRSDIKDTEDYIIYHSVEHDDWWENIAYKYYENEKLWWIVAKTNDIINPFEEMDAGEYIKVIDKRWLYSIVKEVKSLSGQ